MTSVAHWIPLMTPEEQLKILDHILTNANLDPSQNILSQTLFIAIDHLGKLFDKVELVSLIYQRIPRLLSLSARIQDSSKIQDFVVICLSASVPYGLLPPTQKPPTLQRWTMLAEKQWNICSVPIPEEIFMALDHTKFDSLGDLRLVSPLLYRSQALRRRFSNFVQSQNPSRPASFIPLRILLDCSSKQDDYLPSISAHFTPSIVRSVLFTSNSKELEFSTSCLWRMFNICDREFLESALKNQCTDIRDTRPLPLLGALAKNDFLQPPTGNQLVLSLLNPIVSFLSEGYPNTSADKLIMRGLSK